MKNSVLIQLTTSSKDLSKCKSLKDISLENQQWAVILVKKMNVILETNIILPEKEAAPYMARSSAMREELENMGYFVKTEVFLTVENLQPVARAETSLLTLGSTGRPN